jgi:hypothetical protein
MKIGIISDNRVEQGWKLIVELDATNFPLKAAFWAPVGEDEEWRLFIATPLVDQEGPLKAYELIQSALLKLPPPGRSFTPQLELTDISVIGLEDELFKEVKAKAPWAIKRTSRKLNPEFGDLSSLYGKLIYKLGV